MQRKLQALAVCLACALCAVPFASAQPTETSTNDAELDARLTALDAYLADMQRPSRIYFGSWVSILSLLCVGQGVQAVFEEDTPTRASLIVGSSLSAAGLTLVLIAPSPGRHGSKRFRAVPTHSLDWRREKLRQGEAFLSGEAAAVRRTRSWFTHAIAVSFGLGAGLYLGLGFDDNLMNALRTGVGTFVITELRIWTRPTRALAYERDYQTAPTAAPSFGFMPLLAPRATGLAWGGTF